MLILSVVYHLMVWWYYGWKLCRLYVRPPKDIQQSYQAVHTKHSPSPVLQIQSETVVLTNFVLICCYCWRSVIDWSSDGYSLCVALRYVLDFCTVQWMSSLDKQSVDWLSSHDLTDCQVVTWLIVKSWLVKSWLDLTDCHHLSSHHLSDCQVLFSQKRLTVLCRLQSIMELGDSGLAVGSSVSKLEVLFSSLLTNTLTTLASWLIYAPAFVASLHPLAATHFGARLGAFFCGTRFIWSTMYRSTISLRFIWSICPGN